MAEARVPGKKYRYSRQRKLRQKRFFVHFRYRPVRQCRLQLVEPRSSRLARTGWNGSGPTAKW